MKENYMYPLDYTWTKEEMIAVTQFFHCVEEAYEQGITVEKVQKSYQAFKKVVPSIGEEKRLGREFEKVSGYSLYQVVQACKKQNGKGKIHLTA